MLLSVLTPETQPLADESSRMRDRLRQRDRRTWDRLVAGEHARIFNLHLRLTGDPEAAADLTQESFTAAYQSANSYSGDGTPRAWLYGVALNVTHNWLRRSGRREPPEQLNDELPDLNPSTEEVAILRERRQMVVAAVRELPEVYRRTVALRYFAEMSGPEIAQAEGVEPGTIRWRLREASKRLWAILQPKLGEEYDDGQRQN